MTHEHADIGIIGGSGLYDLAELTGARTVQMETPFGPAGDGLVIGNLRGHVVAFIPRHGPGHRLPPADIPVQQNIYALKALGVRQIVSVSAVGSLRADYAPGDLVVPHQIVDWTKGGRPTSFFGAGLVVHVSMADPYCDRLRGELIKAAQGAGSAPVHDDGVYVCIEGPQFSTRAESEIYRQLKMDIIGMTAVPEAKLAREAELCYAGLALVTDYDCWDTAIESVDAELVSTVMARNTAAAQRILATLIEQLPAEPECPCQDAMLSAIITDRRAVPDAVRDRLGLLTAKHFAD